MEYRKIKDNFYGTLLEKYFTPKFRKDYVQVRDCLLPVYYRKFGDEIENMKIRDDDVWVCSFPKTGTTWTQEMVWCIANNLDMEGAKQFLPERFPFLEHSPLFDYSDHLKEDPTMEFPDFVLDSVSYINNLNRRRFIKSHLPFTMLPKQLRENKTNAKIVCVMRNPKDTCVSYYHHCKLLEGYTGNFEDFCQLFMAGYLCFAPFTDHVIGYLKQKERILLIKYEDMKTDLPNVVRKTSEFFSKNHFTSDQIETLCQHLSFDSMKQNKAVNYEPVIEINKKYNLLGAEGEFMRSGSVGGWKTMMNEKLIDDFDKWIEKSFGSYNIWKQ